MHNGIATEDERDDEIKELNKREGEIAISLCSYVVNLYK